MEFFRITVLCTGLMLAGAGYAQDAATSPSPQGGKALDAGQAGDQTLRDAEALMKAGKPAEAYALLEPLEFDRAGEVRFDYLLGIAALDSGKPDKATLALERALTVDPNFAAARLDMARAYYQLGDLQRAQSEFYVTLRQDPDPAARATIQRYLDEIEARKAARQTSINGYAQAGVGRDTNVNNSTSQTQINIPFVGNALATLDPTNVKSADNYFGAAAGAEVIHSLNNAWGVYAGGDLSQRSLGRQTNFNSQALSGRTGVLFSAEAHHFRVGLSGGRYDLGGRRNRDTAGVDGEWRYVLNPGNQLNVFGQVVRYRYTDLVMQPNDFDQQVVGAGWMHACANGKSTISASVYHGTESDVSNIITLATPTGGRTDGAKRFDGVRIGGQAAYGDSTILYASAGGQWGSYGKLNPFFLMQRSDRQADLTLGASWNIAPLWSLRPQVAYVSNNSNIVIYSYNRVDASLTLRRDFK